MTSLSHLRTLSDAAREHREEELKSIPRPVFSEGQEMIIINQIQDRLVAIANLGIYTAALRVGFDWKDTPVYVNFSSNHVIELPGVFWEWWRKTERYIKPHSLVDESYMTHLVALRKIRKRFVIDLMRHVMDKWKEVSDVPMYEWGTHDAEWEFRFDWTAPKDGPGESTHGPHAYF